MASSFAIDSSAIVSIILGEQSAEGLVEKIQRSSFTIVGSPSLAETGIVLSSRGRDAQSDLDMFLLASGTGVVPFTQEHFKISIEAFRKYGKGRHPAALNFGDCMSYAIAKLARLPLLFTGEDFSKTDIRNVE